MLCPCYRHTVRVQLRGSMTFLVLDPTAGDALHFYPAYHAARAQSRVDLMADETESAFPDFHAQYFQPANSSSRTLLLHLDRRATAACSSSSCCSSGCSSSCCSGRATVHRLRAGQSLYVPPFFAVHSFNPGPDTALFADLTSLSAAQLSLAEAEHMQVRSGYRTVCRPQC